MTLLDTPWVRGLAVVAAGAAAFAAGFVVSPKHETSDPDGRVTIVETASGGWRLADLVPGAPLDCGAVVAATERAQNAAQSYGAAPTVVQTDVDVALRWGWHLCSPDEFVVAVTGEFADWYWGERS